MLTISSMDGEYEAIYDYGGFPPELYEVKYPAHGSVELVDKLKSYISKKESMYKRIGGGAESWLVDIVVSYVF